MAARLWAGEQEPVFTADTRLVVLHASVVDKSGKLVTNLPRNAFHVFEDGVEQQLKVFRREDVPVSMGLVIDNSGSMRDKRVKVESSALALVKASNPQDEVFIVNFNDDAFLDVEFTGDLKKMEEGLSRLDSRGGTAMRDAISLSIDHAKEKAKKDKKVILVVTDGNDNTSEITLEKLVQKAQQAEILVYAVGLLNEEDKREAKKARRDLNAITEATGGQAYYPKELEEVGKISLQVAHDIRNQYILAYTPPSRSAEREDAFHEIKVTVNAPNRPVVRTRRGYYSKRLGARQVGSISTSQAPRQTLDAGLALARHAGLPPPPLAQSLPALADRDLLGPPRRTHRLPPLLGFPLDPPSRPVAVPEVGGPHAGTRRARRPKQ